MLEIKKAKLNLKKGTAKVWFEESKIVHKPAGVEGSPNKLVSEDNKNCQWKMHTDLKNAFITFQGLLKKRCNCGGDVEDYTVTGFRWGVECFNIEGEYHYDGEVTKIVSPKIDESWVRETQEDITWEEVEESADLLEVELQRYLKADKYEGKQFNLFEDDPDDVITDTEVNIVPNDDGGEPVRTESSKDGFLVGDAEEKFPDWGSTNNSGAGDADQEDASQDQGYAPPVEDEDNVHQTERIG